MPDFENKQGKHGVVNCHNTVCPKGPVKKCLPKAQARKQPITWDLKPCCKFEFVCVLETYLSWMSVLTFLSTKVAKDAEYFYSGINEVLSILHLPILTKV